MRQVSAHTTTAWKKAVKGGSSRGWVRATIQPLRVRPFRYERDGREGVFTSMVFGQPGKPRELEGIKDVSIKLDVDSGAQTCTITLWNLSHIPMLQPTEAWDEGNHERPGWLSAFRGDSSEWGYPKNNWHGWLVPDRIIRTFEGYSEHIPGWNEATTRPDLDPNMYPSGVWLIDDVVYNADSTVRIECRDLARELIECIAFPPVVPFDEYPMEWEKARQKDVATYTATAGWDVPDYDTSSNLAFVDSGIDDGGVAYVGARGDVRGNLPDDAFDGDPDTYWLSHGSTDGDSDSAWPWIQGSLDSVSVAAVRVNPWGGPYRAYISVRSGGKWRGRKKIPYEVWRDVDTGARKRYVASAVVDRESPTVIRLPKVYENVDAVRVTLHDLRDTGLGKYRFRGGIRGLSTTSEVTLTTASTVAGRYVDYTDIVKWLLGWGGFYWPKASTGKAFITLTNGEKVQYPIPSADPVLDRRGRIWGDLEQTGTAGEAALGQEVWDKKPILDCIRYVADIVAYVFFVDETGGAIFRSPNIWERGNWLSNVDGGPVEGRTSNVLTLRDDEVVLSHSLTLSSRSRRDRIFIANVSGKFGAVVAGYNPHPAGTRRVGGWTDQNFKSDKECLVMADLIGVRQRMRYGAVTVTIPGNPAIQIDDQVIVQERVTGTDHLAYVSGIHKSYDAVTGRYSYDLTLQWLGDPDEWFASHRSLADETRHFLAEMGGRT